MSAPNSPAFVTSDDEHEGTSSSQKQKCNEETTKPKSATTSLNKSRRPAKGSGFNLVSYGLDNDDGDSDSVDDGSDAIYSNSSVSSDADDESLAGDAGTLHFVVSEGGPLTVLSSEHKISDFQAAIEAAQESPVSPAGDTQGDIGEQKEDQQTSHSPSPSDITSQRQQLDVTLPPEPKELCSMHLQNVVESTVRRMQHDIGFDPNRMIQDNKAFRNPSIYKKLISFLDIDEKGTNFSPDIFNPYRWDSNSFYDKLGEIQNREVERLEKLRKERRKAEASGATGTNLPTGLQRTASGPNLRPSNTNAIPDKRSEVKKKTKWDTVEPVDATQTQSKIPAPRLAESATAKVSIPAIGNLFQKK
ncbi:unnamed protein product [Mesocestoides corti]|uniref:SAP30-binding protein n=1 Tax=Mesocestoides corti TaxID=53468 RepID=A0A0R3U9D4_MESCO|nr:unnamed protein product [Mesocestoides corti]